MENITPQQLTSILSIAGFVVIALLIFCIYLNKKVSTLSKTIFSLQRSVDHKDTILENAITQMAKEMPSDSQLTSHDKHTHKIIETLLHKFSVRLNKKIHEKLQLEQSIWQDKFSILLSLMDKTEDDLRQERDEYFKDSWATITELRQKSQLLFNDMQEDGIFYRMQSLWLLSNLNHQQNNNYEAFRYCVAALKLYSDFRPKLPLSQKITWKIGDSFVECYQNMDATKQQEILKKFQMSGEDVLDLFQDLESFESNTNTLQQVRIWYNQLTQV